MKSQSQSTKYTIKYAAVQAAYWPIYCASSSFASVFLLSRNFDNSNIGIVLALANIFAVFLQPMVASYADTTTKISLKNLTTLIAAIAAIITGILIFLPGIPIAIAIFLVAELTLLFTMQPLTNSLGMNMINAGINLNFGLARGIGSISFAIFSYIIGYFVDRCGSDSTVVIAFIMFLFFCFFCFTFQTRQSEQIQAKEIKSDALPLGIFAFAAKYKMFILLLVAVTFTFCSHMMINNYFIQIINQVGGNTKNMGTAIAIAAAVELPAMSVFAFILKKIRCSTMLKLSFIIFLFKTLITFIAANVYMIYFSQVLQFASYAFFIPASIYYVNESIEEKDHVKGQAFVTGAITLAGVIGSLIGGFLLDLFGVKTMLAVGVITSVIGMILAFLSVQKTEMAS